METSEADDCAHLDHSVRWEPKRREETTVPPFRRDRRPYPPVNIRQLEIFCSVMRTRSVSEAARLLRVSQPAVSKALRLMREETGLVLFNRSGNRMIPSAEAEEIFAQARHIFSDIERIDDHVAELRNMQVGRLRIASLATLATTFIPDAVRRLREDRPQVEVDVMAFPSRQVIELIATNEADAGVFHEPTTDPRVRTQEICETELVCVLPEGHRLAGQAFVETADLVGEPLITFDRETSVGGTMEEVFRSSLRPLAPAFVVNQTVIAFSLVSAGAGVALVDPFPMFGQAFPTVVARPFRPTIPLRLRIGFPAERPISRLAGEFAQLLRQSSEALVASSPFRLEMLG